ncbi:MAG: hypothetical protein RLZZ584_1782 [Pseudomonadota bacterium]
MSEVFVSYKREDEARVSALVRALERHGLAVWWDRGVVAGENWRARIRTELDEARAVVVVWTGLTVGAQGRFVQEEAATAFRDGKIVPVRLDAVTLPHSFADLPTIDLRHWAHGLRWTLSRGRLGASPRDPDLLDVVAAVRARLAQQPPPRLQGRRRRLRRRLAWGALAASLLLGAGAFATDAFDVQAPVCTLPLAQPALSDACGAWGLGGRPTQAERLDWAALPRGDCKALQGWLQRYPHGRYQATAAALLATRHELVEQRWAAAVRTQVVSRSASAPARELAEQAAQARATRVDAQAPVCEPESRPAGWACSVEAQAHCQVDEASEVRTEHCD